MQLQYLIFDPIALRLVKDDEDGTAAREDCDDNDASITMEGTGSIATCIWTRRFSVVL